MLVQKPAGKGDTVSIKLITGEELIAVYADENENSITVEKPATLATGPQGVGIMPWIMSAKPDKVSLNKSTVIAMATTDEDIAKSYVQATTNIQLV
jgi:hypothetical protein